MPSQPPAADHPAINAAAYFQRLDDWTFLPTYHVSGAWDEEEQHVAPSLGLMAHAVEADHRARRPGPGQALHLARLSYDIWGTMPLQPMRIEIGVARPGRSIELVEAKLLQQERTVVTLRAWFIQAYDTTDLSVANFPPIPPPDAVAPWNPATIWPGGCIASIEARRQPLGHGRAHGWVRTPLPLIAGEAISPTASAMGLADIANGVNPIAPMQSVAFPNIDLTAHLFRQPLFQQAEGAWLGFDVSVSAGPAGLGLTHTVLHDENGPFGTVAQMLTVRPR